MLRKILLEKVHWHIVGAQQTFMEAMEVSCRSRNAFCLRGSQHALPALPGPMGNADMAQSWEGSSKFRETPREVEAEASFGKGPKTHRQGEGCTRSQSGGPLSSLASRPMQALGMDSGGL